MAILPERRFPKSGDANDAAEREKFADGSATT
jgi:hypothetical protein